MLGKVISIRGKFIHVHVDGQVEICTIKNCLRREKSDQKGTLTIGDSVEINENSQIVTIYERKTILQRTDPLNARKRQVLGANIDQVYITFAIKSPDINIPMLDRYIMAAQKGNLTPIIIINKIDLVNSNQEIDDLVKIYTNIGIKIIPVSTQTKQGIEEVKNSLCGYTSMLSGPSGTGKSSLINLITGSTLEVGAISERIQKGRHTTTFSSLIAIDKETFIIDTPGIASFSVFDLTLIDIAEYFSDLCEPLGSCKFRTCTHTHEPFCSAKQALMQNLISPIRFSSHQVIIDSVLNKESIY